MSLSRRPASFCLAAAAAVFAALAFVGPAPQTAARADTLGQLNSQLGAEQARQDHLNSTIGNLSSLISGLDGQIRLVENRLAGVQEQLAADRAELARVSASLKQERALVVKLRRRLAFARMVLARQLVSSYEGDRPDLVSVVLTADGFNNLLDEIAFLKAAENQQQTTISITRKDKLAADRRGGPPCQARGQGSRYHARGDVAGAGAGVDERAPAVKAVGAGTCPFGTGAGAARQPGAR